MKEIKRKPNKRLFIFFCITALIGLAMGLSDGIFSNYYKDAYNISAFQRGFIEFPRELPGLLCMFIMGIGSFLGDIRLAFIAQAFSFLGLLALGLLTPPFSIMLIFLFLNSLGNHMYMPLKSSIGISLVKDQKLLGKRLGQYSSVETAFGVGAFIIVYFGFRNGFFSFTTKVKSVFLIAAGLFLIVMLLFVLLKNSLEHQPITKRKFNIVFKKKYKLYYLLATAFGVQKQIMLVYGPWVLIDILDKDVSIMSLLYMAGAFIGIFFMPFIGRMLDKYGVRRLLFVDALSFIGVYMLYAFFSAGFHLGFFLKVGIPVTLTFTLFIIDRMSVQMGLVRVAYLKKIIIDEKDLTPTLSMGISMDHVVSILSAYLCGIIWEAFGPHFVFIFAALTSLVNLFVAFKVKEAETNVTENVN